MISAVTTVPTLTISSADSTWSSARFRSGMKPGTSPSSLTCEPKSPFFTTVPVTSFPGQSVASDSPVRSLKSFSPLGGSMGLRGSSKGRRNSHFTMVNCDSHFPLPSASIMSAYASMSSSSTLSRQLSAGTAVLGSQLLTLKVGPYTPSHSALVA